jgi:tripartite-type tricarboxylate transporter receptor subunit TctC
VFTSSFCRSIASRICGAWLLAALCLFSATTGGAAQSAVAEFYKGKSVYLVIGSAAGGGFDAYGRLVARHLGKYIPGNPTVIPQNLDGGGGFRASMRVAVLAPPDGTHIGAILPTTLLDPIIGDPRKKLERLDLAHLGSAGKNLAACFVRADAPVKSFNELLEKELVVGAGNMSSTTREFAALLKNVLGAKLKIAAGYTGNAQIYLAVDRGEVQGMCGTGYIGVSSIRRNWLDDKFVNVIVQESIHGHPDLNAMGVPRTLEFAKSDEQRKMLEIYYSQQEFGRPFVVSAKVPPDRLAALQKALMSTLKDSELLREAATADLAIDPIPGPEVDELVRKAYASSPQLLAKLRQALEYGQ